MCFGQHGVIGAAGQHGAGQQGLITGAQHGAAHPQGAGAAQPHGAAQPQGDEHPHIGAAPPQHPFNGLINSEEE